MADFHQNVVPTFPRLEAEDLERMERQIVRASARSPIGVIIPALYDDLAAPAMREIVNQLANMAFLHGYTSAWTAPRSSSLATRTRSSPR